MRGSRGDLSYRGLTPSHLESPQACPPAPIKRRNCETKLIFEETKWGKKECQAIWLCGSCGSGIQCDSKGWALLAQLLSALACPRICEVTPDACFCYLRGVTRPDPRGLYSHGSLVFSPHISQPWSHSRCFARRQQRMMFDPQMRRLWFGVSTSFS